MAKPTLGGVNLPHPNEYRERVSYRGGVNDMADGRQQTDLVASGAKRHFRLGLLATPAEKADVESAWQTVSQTSAAYTDPLGAAYTVTRAGNADLEWRWVQTANGYRYQTALELREV